jgi:hypothetical protein
MTNPTFALGVFSVSVQTTIGKTYVLEYKDDLNNTTWTAILPGVVGNGTVQVLQDTNATSPMRFYRLSVTCP